MKKSIKQSKVNKQPEPIDLSKVTRVEVIDSKGRSYVNWNDSNQVELSLQDDNKTLKVFVKRKPPEKEILGSFDSKEMCESHNPYLTKISNYSNWLTWAEIQTTKGVTQKQCPKCKRWLFPSEF